MKKMIAVAFVAGLVGFVAGNAFWYLASPLWIDTIVSESDSAADTAKVLASGTFSDTDAVHCGKGTATVYEGVSGQRTLRFTDFEATNGPDLEVWLVAAATVTSNADVTGNDWIALGQPKSNIGDQNYDIPPDVDLSKYRSAVICCEQFGVLFSPASLN